MAHEHFLRRLQIHSAMAEDDLRALQDLPIQVRSLGPNAPIVSEGNRPTQCCQMIAGYAVRSKIVETGRRQILSIHIPGDIPDLQSLYLEVMDCDLRTLGPATVGLISHESLRRLNRANPKVAEALWRDTLIDASIFREWIANVGLRPALRRVAHFIAELCHRMRRMGLMAGDTLELPMTQADLADACGLTAVHANRILLALRTEGIVDFRRNQLKVSDEARLRQLGGFDALYLHQSPDL